MELRVYTIVVMGLLAAGVTRAQTPKNPITTAPEGTQPGCSFTLTGGDNGKTTGSSTCPAAAAAVNPLPETNEEICKRETKQQRELDLRCPSGDASTTPPAPKANAKEQFPFPGETPTQPSAPAAQKFPFPGEGDKSAPSNAGNPLQDAGSSGESSSTQPESSSSSDNRAPSADDVDSDTPVAPTRNAHKKAAATKPVLTLDQRVAEDLNVAAFYANDGNYNGAYMRAKEAVTLADDDPEAHMALASAARKLGKLDEARKNFERTIALDPVPKTKKEAEKALKEMTGG